MTLPPIFEPQLGAHATEDFRANSVGYLRGEWYLKPGVELDREARELCHALWQSGRIKFGPPPQRQADDAAKRRRELAKAAKAASKSRGDKTKDEGAAALE